MTLRRLTMTAVGELSGPGIDTPIRLVTKPGHLFQLPLLYEKGDYVLGNIRLVSADGKTLQTAVPSFANITVAKEIRLGAVGAGPSFLIRTTANFIKRFRCWRCSDGSRVS